ncbi:small multi-drug export protein [bacterium]|nr:small multi-drug export protein [bacterium]
MISELYTFLMAMSPIGELRISIPFGLGICHLSPFSVYFISVIGNLVPVIFLVLFLERISNYLSERIYFFNRFFAWLFEKTRRDHQRKFEIFKQFALVILVAIPLPFTGAWTGSICAFIFGIPSKRAIPLIFIGIMIAGIIVTLATLKVFNLQC